MSGSLFVRTRYYCCCCLITVFVCVAFVGDGGGGSKQLGLFYFSLSYICKQPHETVFFARPKYFVGQCVGLIVSSAAFFSSPLKNFCQRCFTRYSDGMETVLHLYNVYFLLDTRITTCRMEHRKESDVNAGRTVSM